MRSTIPPDGTVTWVASVQQPSKLPVQGAEASTKCWEVHMQSLAIRGLRSVGKLRKLNKAHHIFMPDMSICSAGECRPGTLAGAMAIHRPNAIRMMPNTGASRGPKRNTFSTKINTAIKAIQKRLITPTENSTSIRPQQQATQ